MQVTGFSTAPGSLPGFVTCVPLHPGIGTHSELCTCCADTTPAPSLVLGILAPSILESQPKSCFLHEVIHDCHRHLCLPSHSVSHHPFYPLHRADNSRNCYSNVFVSPKSITEQVSKECKETGTSVPGSLPVGTACHGEWAAGVVWHSEVWGVPHFSLTWLPK